MPKKFDPLEAPTTFIVLTSRCTGKERWYRNEVEMYKEVEGSDLMGSEWVKVIKFSEYEELRKNFIRQMQMKPEDIAKLEWERDEYKRLAESWMKDFDKMKAKHEPQVAVITD